jgi:serine phosphatase RsbU (regulator of sigma subunit)
VAFEPSYNGYGIQNFLDVDPHFDSRAEFRDFVQAAHEQGIYVILDIIAHHTGNVFTYDTDRHPPPLLRRAADGAVRALESVGSYPLGIDESETFQEASVQLERGDVLLLYTDGITDARRTAADLFGVDRLTRMFRDGGDRPEELSDGLRGAVRAHEQGDAAEDDQTLVAARVL